MISTTRFVDIPQEAAIPWGEACQQVTGRRSEYHEASRSQPICVHREAYPATVVEVYESPGGFLDQQCVEEIVDRLEEIVADATYGSVVVDISHVTCIDAQFLNVLASFWRRLRLLGRRLCLYGVCSQCADLLRFSGLDELIDCSGAF